MKALLQIIVCALIIFVLSCEKEGKDSKTIEIKTGENAYIVNRKIDVAFRAYIQFVDNFTGRCPVLLLMPLQGIDFNATLSPERALALAQGIALHIK